MGAEKEDQDFSIDLVNDLAKSNLTDGNYYTCANSSTSFHFRFDRTKLLTRFRLWVAVKGAFVTMQFAFN
jgi:hypothetical protein